MSALMSTTTSDDDESLGNATGDVFQNIAEFVDLPERVDLHIEDQVDPQVAAIATLGREWCRENFVNPIALEGRKLIVEYPSDDKKAWRKVAQRANLRDIEIRRRTSAAILTDLHNKFPAQTNLQESSNERYLHETLLRAAQQHASDIFFEPRHDGVIIRQKIDGLTRMTDRMERERYREIVGLIGPRCFPRGFLPSKPQKGRYNFERDGRHVYVRAQSLPRKLFQESLPQFIFRILQPYYLMHNFTDLGMSERQQAILLSSMSAGNSATIICGPPGSGKSTTIYAALQQLAPRQSKIYAIEDPVETYLPWVWQTEISEDCSHKEATEAILRAAPDYLFVGETMNEDDAAISLNMMLTAVACATSIHADTAAVAIRRLMALKIDPRRIAESVGCIVGQRLVNPVCPECRDYQEPSAATRYIFERLGAGGFVPARVARRRLTLGTSSECDNCFGMGVITPRRALYEVTEMNADVQDAVERDLPLRDIARALYDRDHLPMIVQAINMLINGEIDEQTFEKIPRPYLDASSWIGVAV